MFPHKYLWVMLSMNAIVATYSEDYYKATKLVCDPSPKYFTNHTCRLKPINRYKAVAFMETHIRNVLRNISVNFGLYVRNDANVYKPFLVNVTQNMCWYLAKQRWGPYLKIFMKTLDTYTNINHSCPYTGPIIASNLYLERNLVPVSLPKGSYRISIIFYEGYPMDYIGTVAYYFEIVEKDIRRIPRNLPKE